MEINVTPNEFLMALVGSLEESPNRPALIEKIKQATPETADKVLDEVLVDLAGLDSEILTQARVFVTELNAWKLLQVLVPQLAGVDIPTILPLEAQSLDDPNVQVLSRMPKLTPNETAVMKRVGLVRERVCGEPADRDAFINEVAASVRGKTVDEIHAETERVLNDPWCGLPRS